MKHFISVLLLTFVIPYAKAQDLNVTYDGSTTFDQAFNTALGDTDPLSITGLIVDGGGALSFANCRSITTKLSNLINLDLSASEFESNTVPGQATTGAFSSLAALTNVVLPQSVRVIGPYAFYNCQQLTSINVIDEVTEIGNSAFASCKGVTLAKLPNSLVTIGNNAFSGCSNISFTTVPNSLVSIGSLAFFGCTSLRVVHFPESLNFIGDSGFMNCINLRTIYAPWQTPLVIDARTFRGVTLSLITLNVPTGTTSVYSESLIWQNMIINENITTGIDNESTVGVEAYPNPVTDVLNFTSEKPIQSILVYNLSGRLVANEVTGNKQLNVSNLTPGVYTAKVTTANGTTEVMKIQKN